MSYFTPLCVVALCISYTAAQQLTLPEGYELLANNANAVCRGTDYAVGRTVLSGDVSVDFCADTCTADFTCNAYDITNYHTATEKGVCTLFRNLDPSPLTFNNALGCYGKFRGISYPTAQGYTLVDNDRTLACRGEGWEGQDFTFGWISWAQCLTHCNKDLACTGFDIARYNWFDNKRVECYLFYHNRDNFVGLLVNDNTYGCYAKDPDVTVPKYNTPGGYTFVDNDEFSACRGTDWDVFDKSFTGYTFAQCHAACTSDGSCTAFDTANYDFGSQTFECHLYYHTAVVAEYVVEHYGCYRKTVLPTKMPTAFPTVRPTTRPTPFPTERPTNRPTPSPTDVPTKTPLTPSPTVSPTELPTEMPTVKPNLDGTLRPTDWTNAPTPPTTHPSPAPTAASATPTTAQPSKSPTSASPTKTPTDTTASPTAASATPTRSPSEQDDTVAPSSRPTDKAIVVESSPTSSPSIIVEVDGDDDDDDDDDDDEQSIDEQKVSTAGDSSRDLDDTMWLLIMIVSAGIMFCCCLGLCGFFAYKKIVSDKYDENIEDDEYYNDEADNFHSNYAA